MRRYRSLLFNARPLEWVRTQDEDAAREWEGLAALRLNLDTQEGPRYVPTAPPLPREHSPLTLAVWLLLGALSAAVCVLVANLWFR